VICVTETKLDNNVNSSELLLDNFQNPDQYIKWQIGEPDITMYTYKDIQCI
jgi:hypothetical protein